MHERIHELARQAQLQPYYDAQKEAIKKFAELILFECIKISVFRGDSNTGKAIKEYFEV